MLRSTMVAVCLVGLLTGWAVPGRCAEDEKATPLDPVQKEMKRIRGMIRNANMKLHQGVAALEPGSGSVGSTPGLRCCSGNLERISQSMGNLRDLMNETRSCFEQQRDVDGVMAVNLVVQDLRSLGTALDAFQRSPSQEQASGAMGATQRAYLNLLKSVEALPSCEVSGSEQ